MSSLIRNRETFTQVDSNRGAGRRSWALVGNHGVLLLGGLLMVAPLLFQFVVSISTNAEAQSVPPTLWPAQPQWETYAEVFRQVNFTHQIFITVVITVLRVFAQVALCALAGYAFARLQFAGRGVLLGVILSVMMIPHQIYLVPQYQLVQNLGWLNTIAGIVAPGLASAFGVFLMRQFFMGIPQDIEDAARLDGANQLQIFWKIMLPLASNGLWALAIMSTLWSWNELLWPLIVTSNSDVRPLSVGIANLAGEHSSNLPLIMAASLMAMAPILLLFIALQKRVIDGVAKSGMK